MDRKPDWPALFLLTALIFGAVVRFTPLISSGFPLNDGGMFHTMIRDLKENHYLLPQFTTYNFADIPFAYPPLGFYIAALLSDLLHVSELTILLWLPALINTISILIFYKFAGQLLDSRLSASLAALIYALSPRAFMWQVMGGGITRAFGMLFLLLMLGQAVQLFREYTHKKLVLTTLYGMGAVLSHPQTALHAVLGGALILAFYGRNKRGLISAILTGLGVVLLAAPWWGPVLMRHGLAPMLSAGQTSQRTLESYLAILSFDDLGDYLFLPTLLLSFLGVWVMSARREFLMVVWVVLAFLVDPRGAGGIALLSISMLAGTGLYELSARISRWEGGQEEALLRRRAVRMLVLGLTVYFILVAGIFDFQLINTSLKPADLAMIEWVNKNVPEDKTFLLATGREYSMSDPLQEWFPALTGEYSVTTMQGLEWTLGDGFFPWYEELIAFQHCADMQCVDEWSMRNGVDYDYLVVIIPREHDSRELSKSLRSLGASARGSDSQLLVYESSQVLVFQSGK